MQTRDYCSALQTELDGWKVKTHGAFARFEEAPADEMEKLRPFLSELKDAVEEHTARLENLSKMCPRDLSAKKPRSHRFAWLKEFWDEVGRYQQHRPPHL